LPRINGLGVDSDEREVGPDVSDKAASKSLKR